MENENKEETAKERAVKKYQKANETLKQLGTINEKLKQLTGVLNQGSNFRVRYISNGYSNELEILTEHAPERIKALLKKHACELEEALKFAAAELEKQFTDIIL